MELFQRLNASYLIRTHQVDPLLIEFEDVSFLAMTRCLPNNWDKHQRPVAAVPGVTT